MKKTMIGALVALTLGACTKEETYTRNYYYPTDESDPTGFQKGGNVIINEGLINTKFVDDRTEGFSEFKKSVQEFTP